MNIAVGLLAAPALEAWILLLEASGLVMLVLAELITADRLLVLVVALRFCSITLVANTVFAILDGCLFERRSIISDNKTVNDGLGKKGYDTTRLDDAHET